MNTRNNRRISELELKTDCYSLPTHVVEYYDLNRQLRALLLALLHYCKPPANFYQPNINEWHRCFTNKVEIHPTTYWCCLNAGRKYPSLINWLIYPVRFCFLLDESKFQIGLENFKKQPLF